MAMKDYSDEFKADAVALYESTPGATYKSIAADLGINRATLREWVLRDRERRGAGPVGRPGARKVPAGSGQTAPAADPDERIRQLEARVAELEASPPAAPPCSSRRTPGHRASSSRAGCQAARAAPRPSTTT
ncbi:transposase [Streptomyces sp. NPDC007856]|uniref:transposase n=1 Tax=Streptomyces sp. NPDC007856 TaxID=3364781 RepID=UPI0036811157